MTKRGRKLGQYKYSTTQLLDKLREATKLLGHTVSHHEMDSLIDFPSGGAYIRRFGSWNKALGIVNIPTISTKEARRRCKPTRKKEPWQKTRFPRLKIRFKILERDNFTCQYCGRTPQHGAVLVVDHIIPRSKGGRTISNNLITSCFECNIGKSDVLLNNQGATKKEQSE